MTELFAAIAMLGVFALTGGGLYLLRRGNDAKRGWLMLVAALVLFGNVLILTV